MSHLHCIITRFSYRFKKDDPVSPLLDDKRLEERIKLFKKFCFPSIINQKNKNFYWIIIIDPLLPPEYQQQLNTIFEEFYNSELYQISGPRHIWLHTWNYDDNLGNINWILPYPLSLLKNDQSATGEMSNDPLECLEKSQEDKIVEYPWKYLITTRLDDDESLNEKFTDLIAKELRKPPKIKNFRYISYAMGYQFDSKKITLRRHRIPMIALGLTLITDLKRYPMCVYMGNHTKIPTYVKNPKLHKIMLSHAMRNKDFPITRDKIMNRLKVYRGGEAMYLRNVHGYNLQKNINRRPVKTQDKSKVKKIIADFFNIVVD